MEKQDFSRFHPMRRLGDAVDRGARAAQQGLRGAATSTDTHLRGRALTQGELGMIGWMFGRVPGVERARIFPLNFWWPYPNDRAMTPNGNIYFPNQDFRDDFSLPTVPIELRALFMHEATHLYQHYALGMWLMLKGPFDRNYGYRLEKGKALRGYGIEQMGQIVQDYYTLRNGGRPRLRGVRPDDYADAVPVRR
ncbi:MAG: hypothetical protein EOO77_33040 [Oxalobacteraceae bacterium]|jgi:hypothetical protein|nr:MAG: hypothetical protein EOO77_33040 [Oxalobacteraceae bacterium]